MSGREARELEREGAKVCEKPFAPSRLRARTYFLAPFLVLLLSACSLPGNAVPVVKLGVIAPFEGRGRALGYAILPGVKAAVAEANAAAEFGPYRVAVVAFNDNLDPATAREQAAALALDPDVIGVVGPFSPETAAAALPVLQQASIPVEPVQSAGLLEQDYPQDAAQAKEAARTLLQALAADIREHGQPTRPPAGK
jgi:ABC-type branched-subunit amino acid transport system substrate-binding protein